jgi:hypothetical protein
MTPQVIQHPLDTTWQSIFTFVSWGIVVLMLVIAWRMCATQRTPFYVLAVLAAGVAAFAEPLYDVAFDLWFYDAHANGSPGAMWSTFTAFGVIQPNWTHSGYIILYSMACLYAGRMMYEGRLSRKGLYIVWLLEIAASCVFEMIGTGVNVYTYYGPYVLRIWHYPAVIGVLEGTQVVLFTTLAVQLWRRVSTPWGLFALFAAFPITMFGANFGVGAPVIIALHLSRGTFSSALVWVATLLSIGLCFVAVYGASLFLPRPVAAEGADEERAPVAAAAPVAA